MSDSDSWGPPRGLFAEVEGEDFEYIVSLETMQAQVAPQDGDQFFYRRHPHLELLRSEAINIQVHAVLQHLHSYIVLQHIYKGSFVHASSLCIGGGLVLQAAAGASVGSQSIVTRRTGAPCTTEVVCTCISMSLLLLCMSYMQILAGAVSLSG